MKSIFETFKTWLEQVGISASKCDILEMNPNISGYSANSLVGIALISDRNFHQLL